MKRRNEQVDQLIAALQHLCTLPAGAENEPDQQVPQMQAGAIYGRSAAFPPQITADRPSEIEQLKRENQLLTGHIEMLASALGACSNCWGTIHDCEECGGLGRPGAFDPDRKAFDKLVLPVITHVMGNEFIEDHAYDIEETTERHPLNQ